MPGTYDYSFPLYTVIMSVAAVLTALVGVWATGKDKERMVFFIFFAVALSVVAGIGWNWNINQILDNNDRLSKQLKESETDRQKKSEEHKAEIAALTPYKSAYEQTVQSAIVTASTKDGDRTVFQTVMLNIPTNFPYETIQQNCRNQSMVKAALDPLVAQGKIFAGNRPAWNALMNCALGTSTTKN